MAYNNHASAFFLIALILFATANPLAHGQITGINIIRGLNVSGQLCCTPTGNCPGQPISGALVRLNCTRLLGPSVIVGQGTTGVNGSFNITVPNLIGTVLNLISLPCIVTVQLPLNQTLCPILSTVNGTLVGVLQPVTQLANQLVALLSRLFVVTV